MKAKDAAQRDYLYENSESHGVHSPLPVADTASLADPVEFNLDPYAGFYNGSKIILPLDGEESVTSHLDSGRSIDNSNGVITYTFNQLDHATGLFNNKNVGLNGQDGYSAFSPEQQDAAREAIQLWDDLIPQTFREISGRGADIVFANSDNPAQAFAYYPVNGSGAKYQSDVFVANPANNPSNELFNFGQYGNTTLIHEIGHAVGLSHPGAYNGSGTFASDAEYAQDTYQYSIMSYFNGTNSGQLAFNWDLGGVVPGSITYDANGNTTGFSFRVNYPEAPQLHDIYVMQEKYGADPSTHVDDTTYGFNSTADNALYDFNVNEAPMYSIYDAGGVDTIDASGFDVGQYINLHAGAFSSIGGGVGSADHVNAYWTEYYDAYGLEFPAGYFTDAFLQQAEDAVQNLVAGRIEGSTGVSGIEAVQYDNVSIAYGTTIENAIGGSARDLLIGNEVDNILNGLDGDDVLQGYEGNDTLIGGDGADTFVFDGLELGDVITDFDGGESDMIDLGAFADARGADLSFVGGADLQNAGDVNYVDGVLSMDYDGDGAADFAVSLDGDPTVDASMLMLAAGA